MLYSPMSFTCVRGPTWGGLLPWCPLFTLILKSLSFWGLIIFIMVLEQDSLAAMLPYIISQYVWPTNWLCLSLAICEVACWIWLEPTLSHIISPHVWPLSWLCPSYTYQMFNEVSHWVNYTMVFLIFIGPSPPKAIWF